jgi:hypothetical protein
LPATQWQIPLRKIGTQSLPVSMSATKRFLLLVTADGSVVAIDVTTRQVRWRRHRADLGITPRVAFPSAGGTMTILGEPSARPVSILVETGAVVFRWPHPAEHLLQSGCAVSGVTLISSVDTGASLLIHNESGVLRRRSPLPWPEYEHAHALQRQLLLARDDSSSRCVGALAIGDGIVAISAKGIVWAKRYREPFVAPEIRVRTMRRASGDIAVEARVENRTTAAREIASTNGIAFVAFGGMTPLAGKIIDMYAVDSGAYIGTLLFPHVVRRISAAGHTLYVALYERGYPVIHAYDLGPE